MEKETKTQEQLDREAKRQKLLEQIRKSEYDPEAMEAIRRNVNADKETRNQLARMVNLYEQTIGNKLDKITSDSPLVKECLLAGCAKLKDELGYSKGNALERITIEHIVLCWLDLSLNENSLAGQTHNSGIELLQKRVEFSSKRLNRAMLTLSKMRKMNLVIQVNNASQQIVNNS